MRKLVLIKHARPSVDPTSPSSQWTLSTEGIASCGPLAEALKPLALDVLISSTEPKAIQTAQHVAGHLSLQSHALPGLEEHHRDTVPHLATRDFLASMAQVFKQPRRRILGEETAHQASERFLKGIADAIDRHPAGNIAVVTHGTVIALYLAYYNDIDPYMLWRQMSLPSFVVVSMEDHEILETRLSV